MSYQSNSRWVLDEWILSLEVYMQHRHLPIKEQERALEKHSKVRWKLGVLLGHNPAKQEKYRNVDGLWLNQQQLVKLQNGDTNNKRVSQKARLVWDLFHQHPASLRKACDIIYASLLPFISDIHRRDGVIAPIEDNLSSLHPQGFYLTQLHVAHDRPLLRAVVSGALSKGRNRVACRSCKDKFRGRDIQDLNCHYSDRDQLNLLVKPKFNSAQYHLYCEQCHDKEHAKKPWINLQEQHLVL